MTPRTRRQIRLLFTKYLLKLQAQGVVRVRPILECPGFGYEVQTPDSTGVVHYFPGSGKVYLPGHACTYTQPITRHITGILQHFGIMPVSKTQHPQGGPLPQERNPPPGAEDRREISGGIRRPIRINLVKVGRKLWKLIRR